MKIEIEVSDNATNYEVYEAVFGFVDEKHTLSCRFIEDEFKPLRYNKLSKTWGNAPYVKETEK